MLKLLVYACLAICALAAPAEKDQVPVIQPLIDDTDDSRSVLYSEVPMSNLVSLCLASIPVRYRERCLVDSFERYAGSVFPLKARCCAKWAHIACLEQYAYNNAYCDMHQRVAVSRFFDQVKSTRADGSPECTSYRPIEEEEQLWSSKLGRIAKCKVNVGNEL